MSNNNTIDRSISGDESDRTILILGIREPKSFEEKEVDVMRTVKEIDEQLQKEHDCMDIFRK